MSAKPIKITYLADTSQLSKSLAKTSGQVDSASRGFGDKLGSASRKATIALAGVTAAGVGAALQAEKIASANARVGNVLDNMGMDKATERTLAYADALEKSLGIDEEVIKNTQAKLATFESLALTADEAGGMFDRATLAAQDLAAAGFGTAESNAAQLGKALQDPIKGLAALTKSGVTFTDAEKKRIETLVESNKLGEAQGVVMAAIEKQVGGTAEATADSSAKMRLAFGEVAEQVGSLLLPVMDKAAVVLQQVADVAGAHPKVFVAVGGAIAVVTVAVIAANAAYKTVIAVTKAWTVAQKVLNVVLRANPIGLIITALALLAAGFVIAYKKSETFRDVVKGAMGIAKEAVSGVVNVFDNVVGAIKNVIGWIGDFVGKIRDALGWVKDLISDTEYASNLGNTLGGVQNAAADIGDQIRNGQGGKGKRDVVERVEVTINGLVTDPAATGRALEKALNEHARRTGRRLVWAG